MSIENVVKDCFDSQVDIGASTPEPALWHMVQRYYISHGIDPATARKHADSVMNVFAKGVAERLSVLV